MTYWVTSSITRKFTTTTYINGTKVYINLANGYGTISSVNPEEELSLGSIQALQSLYQLNQISISPLTVPTVTDISLTTTTTKNESYIVYENINQASFVTSIEVKDSNPDNYFTNSYSYNKYIRNGENPDRGFSPAAFFSGTFYPHETENFDINLNDYYVGLLLEFELKLSHVGDYSTLFLNYTSDESVVFKTLANIIIHKNSENVLFKSTSPISSFMYLIDDDKVYSTTSEMAGITVNTTNNPNRAVKIKLFVFNDVFYKFQLDFKNRIKPYKDVPRLKNVSTLPNVFLTSTTTTTTAVETFPYNTDLYLQDIQSITTPPIHFTLTAYRQ